MTPPGEPRWLDDTELVPWMRFSGMLLKLHSALDAELQREAGLSFFTYLVLAGLSEAPERTLRMSDLAVLANGSLSRLSHAVAKLERRGWVRRHPCPENGRITLATLTDEGLDKIRASAPAHVESVRRLVIDVLSEEQLRRLGEISLLLLAGDGTRFAVLPRARPGRSRR